MFISIQGLRTTSFLSFILLSQADGKWYLNQRMISYDKEFHVEPLMSNVNGLGGLQWPVGTILSVTKTNSLSHDGNYTCAPSTLTSDSVLVHIIDDGKIPPAAVYGDSSKAGLKIIPGLLLYVMSQLLSNLLSY